MEAAVLKPQMMAELEVQKLQELVRRLERQNEQLRTRASIAPPSRCSPSPSLARRCLTPDDPFPYFQPHSAPDEEEEEEEEPRALLDELLPLDLDRLSPSGESEETWLYVSPRSPPPLWAPCHSALRWARQVLDQQRLELEPVRLSLCHRLESVSGWRSGLSSPALPRARVAGVPPLCSSSCPSKPSAALSGGSSERAGRSVRRGVCPSVDSDVCELDAAAALAYKLTDLTDVQVMARLQEESLRQDFASSSRRSASFSFRDSQADEEDEEDEDEEYGSLPPPAPRLQRLPHSHTFSSLRDWTRASPDSPTPPPDPSETPAGLRSSDKLRRSMPNLLSCVPAAVSPVSPCMRSSQSLESRLQACGPAPAPLRSRVQSVGNFSSRPALKATAYVSPTVKGPSLTSSTSLQCLIPKASQIPARSGLPRPASFVGPASGPRGKLGPAARSLLTPPKSLATLSALRDGSWRDGCY